MLATLLVCSILFAVTYSQAVLENVEVSFTFSKSGGLTQVLDKNSLTEFVGAAAGEEQPVWSLQFVDALGHIMVHSTHANAVELELNTDSKTKTQSLHILYKDVPIGTEKQGLVSVTLQVDLADGAQLANWSLSLLLTQSSTPLGLWEAHVNVPVSVGTGSHGDLFFPSGLGQGFRDPFVSTGGAVEGDYPSGGCVMQYMALADDDSTSTSSSSSSSSGLYVSAHDPEGYLKLINYSTLYHRDTYGSLSRVHNPTQKESYVAAEDPALLNAVGVGASKKENDRRVHMLTIVAYPENAGTTLVAGSTWAIPYPIAVGVVRDVSAYEGKPLWFQAAQVYRKWVLGNAKWTEQGPLSNRKDLPEWYSHNSIWLNSNWQCHDIFNATGGSPDFVAQYTKEIASLLDQPSLINHWYEWQQGPDPAPDARYLFDTHYPDYFPPRKGFKEVMQELLQDSHVYTVPYINGRIFDINSDSFLQDDGEQYCTKQLADGPRLVTSDAKLETIIETYGSNATFCVANPSTKYWQEKIVDAAVELISEWGSAGVYIDQIGAAKPYLCYDASMGHTLGGGLYWKNGYSEMLASIKKAQPTAPIITECNAEPYMDNLDGYLVLTSFKGAMSQAQAVSKGDSKYAKSMNSAFNAVYGGYYVAMGAEWTQADFVDHDWWRGKLAQMFSSGSQLGWFSLNGLDDADGADHCGPMGVGENFKDPENADLVQYLRLLAAYRRTGSDYFVNGRIASPVMQEPPIQVLKQTAASASEAKGGVQIFDALSVSAWHQYSSPSSSSSAGSKPPATMAVFASNTLEGYKGKFRVDFSQWNYAADATLRVEQLFTGASDFNELGEQRVQRRDLGTITGPQAWLPIDVTGVDVLMLEFSAV